MLNSTVRQARWQKTRAEQCRNARSFPSNRESSIDSKLNSYIAYKSSTPNVVHLSRVVHMSVAEAMVAVHRHYPVSDSRLRIKLTLVFVEEGAEVLGTGATPSLENVAVNRILRSLQLHSGVMGHDAARCLGNGATISIQNKQAIRRLAQRAQIEYLGTAVKLRSSSAT